MPKSVLGDNPFEPAGSQASRAGRDPEPAPPDQAAATPDPPPVGSSRPDHREEATSELDTRRQRPATRPAALATTAQSRGGESSGGRTRKRRPAAQAAAAATAGPVAPLDAAETTAATVTTTGEAAKMAPAGGGGGEETEMAAGGEAWLPESEWPEGEMAEPAEVESEATAKDLAADGEGTAVEDEQAPVDSTTEGAVEGLAADERLADEDAAVDGQSGDGSAAEPRARAASSPADRNRRPPPGVPAASSRAAMDSGASLQRPPQVPRASEYGPSLDVKSTYAVARRSIFDEIREIEQRVRGFFAPRAERGRQPRSLSPLGFLWRRYRALAMRQRSELVDEFGRDPLAVERMSSVLDFLYGRYFRVSVEGIENIPDTGRALIVANHSGTLPYDAAMIMHAVNREHPARREVRPLVEDFVFHFPYLGVLLNRIGGVRACQENAERLLEGDRLVAVFPEGIKGTGKLFRHRYQLQRFGRGGFVKLALRAGAPIIPTAVIGAEETHPTLLRITWMARGLGMPYLPITPTFPWLGPLGLLPLPSKWRICFGRPLDFAGECGPGRVEDRILVNRLAESVRSRIQEMVDEQLARRKSVLLG